MLSNIDPKTLSTGKGVARVLNSLHYSFIVQDLVFGRTTQFHKLDWEFIPDIKYRDRVHAVHRPAEARDRRLNRIHPRETHDLSHAQIFETRSPIWQPISVPPAYKGIPEGEELAFGYSRYPFGSKIEVAEDATYCGGQVVPKGTILTMAGYKTARALRICHLCIVFEPIARFPDGTYRNVPRSARPTTSS
jgi:hypothetical protein